MAPSIGGTIRVFSLNLEFLNCEYSVNSLPTLTDCCQDDETRTKAEHSLVLVDYIMLYGCSCFIGLATVGQSWQEIH